MGFFYVITSVYRVYHYFEANQYSGRDSDVLIKHGNCK